MPYLPRRGRSRGQAEMLVKTRGPYRFGHAHVASVFPFGFFRKGLRFKTGVEERYRHALRLLCRGDDAGGIHWKQTARTGQMVYLECEAERSRRLAVVFDNAVGELPDEAARQRTREELAWMEAEGNLFIHSALTDAVRL